MLIETGSRGDRGASKGGFSNPRKGKDDYETHRYALVFHPNVRRLFPFK